MIQIPTTADNELRPCLLESQARAALKEGKKIAAIIATTGTTDAFGLDDLDAILEVRDRLETEFSLDYRPHVHADAVIGWAWSVFNDYDFRGNPLGFPHRTVRRWPAPSAASPASARPIRWGSTFTRRASRPTFRACSCSATLPISSGLLAAMTPCRICFNQDTTTPANTRWRRLRSGSAPLAAMANMLLFGKDGMRSLLGHLVTMAEILRDHLNGHPATTVLNSIEFRPRHAVPRLSRRRRHVQHSAARETDPGYRETLRKHNDYNRRIFELVQTDALAGQGIVISMTDCYRLSDYGEPIVALKSYIMTPFSDEQYVQAVLESLWKARTILAEGSV